MLSTTRLDECYRSSMAQMVTKLIKAPSATLGMDGATNVLSRSTPNVIVHDLRPWFVEYLRAGLKKESAPEVFKKIEDSISRIHAYLQKEVVLGVVQKYGSSAVQLGGATFILSADVLSSQALELNRERQKFEVFMVTQHITTDLGENAVTTEATYRDGNRSANEDDDENEELTDAEFIEQEVLSAALAQIAVPREIPDHLFFPEQEE
ncbi:hypothetical protein L915_16058 [Phytophthora nicotianae]|uniref:Uncharacterized protein n=2 Tax=Phytophthora nicotianae TaxID=4792 RepID=W2PQL0_PHYN3|nr:hypothetical protein PPTG_23836 [Phytophthora nicotianae INRA-310]ETK77707.1 hypothetical protein L915_16058 [Phytophthora nicotianae]ETN03187.1 hypothetical protein PPTG_23836 [Phytophthora nicotianae INRA-310]